MRRHAFVSLLVALTILSGCKSKPQVDSATWNLLEAAGGEASVVVVLHPERWPQAVETLKPFTAEIPITAVKGILEKPDAQSALEQMLTLMTGKLEPVKLEGWDTERPMVAALFEPVVNDTVRAARLVIPVPTDADAPGLRNRVLVPASDTGKLMSTLGSLVTSMGAAREKAADGIGGLKGGGLFVFRDTGTLVALIPEDRHVRIEMLNTEGQMRKREMPEIERWLGSVPPGTKPLRTPALSQAAGGRDIISVYLRTWQLRDWASISALGNVLAVMAYVSPDEKDAIFMKGLSEIGASYQLMSPSNADLDDWTFGLDLSDGIRFHFIASIPDRGRKILEKGLSGTDIVFTPGDKSCLASGWMRLNFEPLLEAAEPPAAFRDAKNLRDVMEPIYVAGAFGQWYLMLRKPLGLSRTIWELSKKEAPFPLRLPESLSFAVLGMDPKMPGGDVRMAAAGVFPSGEGVDLMVKGLEKLAGSYQLKMFSESVGDRTVLWVGTHQDPRKVLTKKISADSNVLGEINMDLEAWLGSMGEAAPGVPESIRRIRARTSLAGFALVGQYVAGDRQAAFKDPEDYSGPGWEAPDLKQASSKGAKCLEQVGLTLSKFFDALSYADPAERPNFWMKALKEIQGPLACAIDDSATSKMGGFARERLALHVAGQMDRYFKTKEQLEILHEACEQGHAGACREEKRVRAMPRVQLARVSVACGHPPTRPLVIRIPGGDEPTRPALSEISSRPADDSPMFGRPIRSAALAIDQGAPVSKYYEVAKGLGLREIVASEIVLEDPERGVVSLPVDIAPRFPIKKPPLRKGEEGVMGKKKSGILAILEESSQLGGGFEGPPLWIQVKQETIELKTPEGTAAFEKPADCPKEGPCLDTPGLASMLHTLTLVGRPIYLDAAPDTPWHNLATVLGSLACTLKEIKGTGTIPPICLCPPTADVLEQVAKAPKSPPADKQKGVPSLLSGKPIIMGSLSKQAISGTIYKHIKQVKHCYEKELLRNASLQGKVSVKFTIAPNGRVAQANISSSTARNKSMEACIIQAVKRMRFPKPKGGGIVIVNYPFVFKTAK